MEWICTKYKMPLDHSDVLFYSNIWEIGFYLQDYKKWVVLNTGREIPDNEVFFWMPLKYPSADDYK